MTPQRWRQITELFHAARERDPAQRDAFLAVACPADAELRREVEAMLAAHEGAGAVGDASLLSPDSGLEPGFTLGSYRIEHLIGSGGMGEVYRARDTTLGRAVAIKILPRAFTGDPDRLARLKREARMLAALNHPRIGAIYGLERMDDVPALVLELVEGPTLTERLANGPLAMAEALAIAIAIAEALEAAHDRGIIHRDVKPANIKITPAGGVKVLDFGLAKDVTRHDAADLPVQATRAGQALDLSQPGSVMGTVAYMSPEQARGDAIDARTDLFSLGAVLYETVTGRRAFAGAESSRIVDATLRDTPPSPRLANPEVPPALERVILRLLEPARDARYQTASDVRADLMQVAVDIDAKRSAQPLSTRRQLQIVVVAAIVTAGLAGWLWSRLQPRAFVRGEYTQITHFADSATSPALSPDGRLLAFIRGTSTFEGPGQIYLKQLPDGDPVQLTTDRSNKMSPIFSPDGSRIAYTSMSDFAWDTWVVPVVARTPRFWLANASGLTWIDNRHVLFSEITKGLHMRVVSADDRRDQVRAVYSPDGERGMAHRSYPSPDGAWALVAEMVQPVWQPCRLVAMSGRTSRPVGPPGQCTNAAWSPDGKWMYFSSNSSGSFHIWRQRFPDGTPEQISFGPGEEEGVAVSPDGRSLLTSIGNRQSSMWVRDSSGEREVSREGYAFVPSIPNSSMSQPLSPDGRSLLYLVRQGAVQFAGPGERAGELWRTNLETSQSEALFPGMRVSGYDVSRDGTQIVFAALDDRGASHLWLGRMDRRVPPHQLSTAQADSPRFRAGGHIYYRGSEGGESFIYRITAGGEPQKVVTRPVLFFLSVSPDEAWVVARVEAAPGANSSQENLAFPTTSGGAPVQLCPAACEVDWTPNGSSLVVKLGDTESRLLARTLVVALHPGETLPRFPPHGIRSEADLADLRILQVADGSVYPANVPPLVVLVRSTTERNIYRIPLF